MAKELSDEGSEESSDNLSDSQSTENSSSDVAQEGRRGRWMRRGTVLCIHNHLYTKEVYWLPTFTIIDLKFIADFKIN